MQKEKKKLIIKKEKKVQKYDKYVQRVNRGPGRGGVCLLAYLNYLFLLI